ncbi:MAG: hypothetical protein COY42_34515 [Armatimonadetes bacterium CG_4_10_14_0_8_um_filter_66_14]|nr:type II toxin-antitoxin system Phd/YefM family antitoxin [Armatimonadota bacterium]PIZ30042.1 MAG: hypothetical protein COY42_34515 [Armatimonadetes bacterium CG_4_10_14_0_8_um_filter_66_14]
MRLVDIAEAQINLSSLLVAARGERVFVAQGGEPVGVLLSVADYQDWAGMTDGEVSALFRSPAVQAKLERAHLDYAAGRTVAHEEVGRRLTARVKRDE